MDDPSIKDTRQQLLEAAAEEFAQHGLKGARMRAIVQRAGINERMIYHHFGSKEGLYRAVLQDQWLGGAAGLQAALEQASALAPEAGLRQALLTMFEGMLARPHLLALAMHEALGGWQHVPTATLGDVPEPVRALYARGQREGVFRADCDFELLYLTAIGALTSTQVLAARFKGRKPARGAALAEQVVDLILRGARA